jgi:hypothetical protein
MMVSSMILFLADGFDDSPPAAGLSRDVQHLLARLQEDGTTPKRGPLVTVRSGDTTQPLAALRDGDKLHVVAQGVAGQEPRELVHRLEALGLTREVRLKQLHLLADDAGGEYVERLAEALAADRYQIGEIKAPRGAVAWDATGKVHVRTGGDWQPSDKTRNAYAGPDVQPKHRH